VLPTAGQRAIDAADAASDELVSEEERVEAATSAFEAYLDAEARRAARTIDGQPPVGERAVRLTFELTAWESYGGSLVANRTVKLVAEHASNLPVVALIRDIFGNPFRPVTFSPDWRTGTVVSLARQMYEGREFSAMPILADALQDAGCDNADVLDHCRGSGPHIRGCWVVDLVLGKT
jgi:hypothetical protein